MTPAAFGSDAGRRFTPAGLISHFWIGKMKRRDLFRSRSGHLSGYVPKGARPSHGKPKELYNRPHRLFLQSLP